ncbi:hypothetical protein Tco_1187822 [Tanacetum coccineum]
MEITLKEEDHSEFRKRVFPGVPNLKGEHLLKLINKDVKFNKLDDEDVVRVCLLLALDYVFMGQELRQTWALETFSNSIHWWRKDENVRHEVHVRAVDKEDVSTRDVDGEDMQERAVLAKTVKAQEQMIVDLQHRLFSLEEITKQLKTGPSDGPSDVDHLDKVTSFA